MVFLFDGLFAFFLFCPGVHEFYCSAPRGNAIFINNVLPEYMPNKTMWFHDILLRLLALSVINSASLKWNAKQNIKEDR